MPRKDSKRTIVLDAKPEPLRIDTSAAAVLVVDMQNDFGAPGGMFDRAGIDISQIKRVVEPTRRTIAAARAAAIPIVYLKQEHRQDLSDAGAPDQPHRIKHDHLGLGEMIETPDGHVGRILIKDAWNTEILSELTPESGDTVVSKHRYSGFFETNLDATLKSLGAKYLIVTGCTTSVCVESTIRDAMFRGYLCVLLSDCTAEPIGAEFPRTNHDASLLVIERLFGWVSTSDRVIGALEA